MSKAIKFRPLTEEEIEDGYGYCFRNHPFEKKYYSKRVIISGTIEPIDINVFLTLDPENTEWYKLRKDDVIYMGIGKPVKEEESWGRLKQFIGAKKEEIKALKDTGSKIVQRVSSCINCGDLIYEKEERDLCIMCRVNPYHSVHSSNALKIVDKEEREDDLEKLDSFLLKRADGRWMIRR